MAEELEKKAGGMSYRIMKGINTSLITPYLEGHDKKSSAAIFEKNQEYYIASANKTISRLELANIRVKYTENLYKGQFAMDRINHGLSWLNILITEIKNTTNNLELQAMIPYKKWHAVKLIPSAAEGYAMSNSIKMIIKQLTNNHPKLINAKKIKDAETHIDNAQVIFLNLLNLDESSNFIAAEKSHLNAYKEIKIAQSILKTIETT
ncbi:MAG: hypothetical protein ACXVHW_07765 [Methanobacterium sp.]